MGPVFIIVSSPVTDDLAGMCQISEPVFIQALVTKTSIEAFNKTVLGTLPGLDQLQLHTIVISPLVQSLTCALRPLVCPESLRVASEGCYRIQGAGNLVTKDTVCHGDIQALLGEVINNAGVLRAPDTVTRDGLDVRFAVNTIAPYLLTHGLLPLLAPAARVVNVSSAAQSPVELDALRGKQRFMDDMADAGTTGDRVFVAVNPGSLLGSKMVKEGFGIAGKSLSIGADVLVRAALSEEFASASGWYFDNDEGRFGSPHADALNAEKCQALVEVIEELVASHSPEQ